MKPFSFIPPASVLGEKREKGVGAGRERERIQAKAKKI